MYFIYICMYYDTYVGKLELLHTCFLYVKERVVKMFFLYLDSFRFLTTLAEKKKTFLTGNEK